MTLKEYLIDYAAPETKEIGESLILEEIKSIPKEKIQEIVRKNLIEIEKGNQGISASETITGKVLFSVPFLFYFLSFFGTFSSFSR